MHPQKNAFPIKYIISLLESLSLKYSNILILFVDDLSLLKLLDMKFRGCLHEISFRAKWNIFISVSGQFLVTVYMIQPEIKLIADVISLRSFWQKWNLISGDKISCKHYPKWNHMKGNICTCVNKNDWLLFSGPFISGHPRNEIRFISPTMKSNINRISFIVDWNFVSGDFISGLM